MMEPIYHSVVFEMKVQKGNQGRIQIPKLVRDMFNLRDGITIDLTVNDRIFSDIKLTSGEEILLGQNSFPEYERATIRIENPR